jgi:hypothetical protein
VPEEICPAPLDLSPFALGKSTERETSGRAPKTPEERFVFIPVIRGCQDQTTAANAVSAALRQTWRADEEFERLLVRTNPKPGQVEVLD